MTMTRWRDERGAVLVQTGIALIGLLAMGTLSVDYGMLWVARRQAQNAADSAALAGAISLAFGDPDDTARVKTVAVAAGQANRVWGAAPVIEPTDVYIEECPPGAPGDPDLCVRVEVFRNQERGNPLPTWFGQLVGVAAHGVKATATAQVASGTKSTCVKPWVIPDKWIELRPAAVPWDLNQTYERYDGPGSNPGPNWSLLSPADNYIPPSANSPGSGFSVPDDVGMRLTIKVESWKDGDIGPGNYRSVVFPSCPGVNAGTGGDLYRCNIANCNPTVLGIGDTLQTEPGAMVGPTTSGLSELIGSDNAVWLCSDGSSSAGRDCPGYPSIPGTPRLVPVPAFNVQQYFEDCISGVNANCNGRATVTISRMLGFFIEGWDNKEIWGRFTYYPDVGGISNGEVDDDANFLRKVILVR
jgi:hypothetical protein